LQKREIYLQNPGHSGRPEKKWARPEWSTKKLGIKKKNFRGLSGERGIKGVEQKGLGREEKLVSDGSQKANAIQDCVGR